MAKVHVDIKDGSRLFYVKSLNKVFLTKIRSNPKHTMENHISFGQWKYKMLDWYQFRAICWYFEEASRFLSSRLSITCSLQFCEKLGSGKTSLTYSSPKESGLMSLEPTFEEEKIYHGIHYHR